MLKAAALALAIAAMSVSAEAAPLMDDFQSMCVKTDLDAKAALAAADSAGWMPIPQALLAQLTSSAMGLQKADGRLHSDAGGMHFLVVGDTAPNMVGGDFPKGIDRASVCALGSAPSEAGFEAKLADWVAVPQNPSFSKRETHGYAFFMDGDRRKPLDPAGPDFLKLAEARRVRVVFLESSPQLTMVGIVLPSKEPH
jgi:hypothetical protein